MMEEKYRERLKTYNLKSSLDQEEVFFLSIVDAQRNLYAYKFNILILNDWKCYIYAEEEVVTNTFVDTVFAFLETELPPFLQRCLVLWQEEHDYAQNIPSQNMFGLDYGALYYLKMKHKRSDNQVFRYSFASSPQSFKHIPEPYRENFTYFIDTLFAWKKQVFASIYCAEKSATFLSFEIKQSRHP